MFLDYNDLSLNSTDGNFSGYIDTKKFSAAGIYCLQYKRDGTNPWPSTALLTVCSTHHERPGSTILKTALSTGNWRKYPRDTICTTTGAVAATSGPVAIPICDHRLKVTLASSAGVYRGKLAVFIGGE